LGLTGFYYEQGSTSREVGISKAGVGICLKFAGLPRAEAHGSRRGWIVLNIMHPLPEQRLRNAQN
jgi:hypothetical protein